MIDKKMMNTKLLASISFIHSKNNFPADICEYLVIFSTNILNPIEIFSLLTFCPYCLSLFGYFLQG